jgi:hypothetical protein
MQQVIVVTNIPLFLAIVRILVECVPKQLRQLRVETQIARYVTDTIRMAIVVTIIPLFLAIVRLLVICVQTMVISFS